MPNKTLKKRLAQLESAIMPKAIGIIRDGQKLVSVGRRKMTVKRFKETYPGGMLIRVIRHEYRRTRHPHDYSEISQ